MKDSVPMAKLTWPECAQEVKEKALVHLPIGATEPHRPHIALSVDVVVRPPIAERVARKIDGVAALAIPYSYKSQPCSGSGEFFPGTTSFDVQILYTGCTRCHLLLRKGRREECVRHVRPL